MDERRTREIFFKNYNIQGELNQALILTSQEIGTGILKDIFPEPWPDIIPKIIKAKSYLDLFFGMVAGGLETVHVWPETMEQLDFIRQTVIESLDYICCYYDVTDGLFKDRYSLKQTKEAMQAYLDYVVGPSRVASDARMFGERELKVDRELLSVAFFGIIGWDNCVKYGEAYNKCTPVLRQCQMECKMLKSMDDSRAS